MKILFADDDVRARNTFGRLLARFGHDVFMVQNGLDAIQLLHTGKYDLVITDNEMGSVSGLEVIEYIKNFHPALPVILFTGGRLTLIPRGVTVLYKPCGESELREAIVSALLHR